MDGSFCVHKLDNLSKSANFIINFQLLLFFPIGWNGQNFIHLL